MNVASQGFTVKPTDVAYSEHKCLLTDFFRVFSDLRDVAYFHLSVLRYLTPAFSVLYI